MPSRILLTLSLCAAAVLGVAAPAAAIETGVVQTLNQTKPNGETAASLLRAGCACGRHGRGPSPPGLLAARHDRQRQPRRGGRQGARAQGADGRAEHARMGQRCPRRDDAADERERLRGRDGPVRRARPRRGRLGAVERGGRGDLLGRRRGPGEVRGDGQVGLSARSSARSRATSSSRARRRATTSSSSRRSTATASRARSTRSGSTRTRPAWSTAPASTTASPTAASAATRSPATARCTP